MAEDKENRFRGGKQASRDDQFGIDDRDFSRRWHRVGKAQAGGADLDSRQTALDTYQEWIDLGRPNVR